MTSRLSLYVLFFLLCHTFLFGQESDFIRGTVIDQKTGEPVVFANIRIKGRAVGVITNVDGSFRIPLKYKEYGDIIEISSMGYRTKEIPIIEFVQDGLTTVVLDPGAIDLQEAIVKGKDKRGRNLSAKQIVQRAIEAIPKNYPSTSFSIIGYYRDYQFDRGEYINLNEGIMEVYDQGFDQLDDRTTETRIFNFDLNKNFRQDSMARTAYDYRSLSKTIKKAHLDAYGGNEFRILRIHDAIRNYEVGAYDFIGVLKTDFVKNHTFKKEDEWFFDNELLYKISFVKTLVNYRAHGTIYISKNNFAIRKLEYVMYDKTKTNENNQKDKNGVRNKMIFDITTEYEKKEGKMYLNYISFQNSFTLNVPPVFKIVNAYLNRDTEKGDRHFAVEFTTMPEKSSAISIENYVVKFKNRKIKIRTIQLLKNKVLIYPNMVDDKFDEMKAEIMDAERNGIDINTMIDTKVTNVRDTMGNLIDEWTQKEYQQYREFFVQRVKPNSRAPLEGKFMDKRKPIFDDQPIQKPKDYKEYWMNTPLHKNINSFKK